MNRDFEERRRGDQRLVSCYAMKKRTSGIIRRMEYAMARSVLSMDRNSEMRPVVDLGFLAQDESMKE